MNRLKLTWETLRDVTFKKKWYAEESIYMLHPTFGPSVQKLKNQQVSITGYILPIDLEANLYVLSAFPFSACFFCGGAGPETVMTLNFKKKDGKKFKTDERLTFTGTLKLNADDIYQMNYILDGAEIGIKTESNQIPISRQTPEIKKSTKSHWCQNLPAQVHELIYTQTWECPACPHLDENTKHCFTQQPEMLR
jgi:hypothetical protein